MVLDRCDIIHHLAEENRKANESLYQAAYNTKVEHVGESVYLRGLVEISNICRKSCLYCGIRSGNENVARYELSDEEILSAARFALDAGYGSLVLQGGERQDKEFVLRISRLIKEIKSLDEKAPLGITLSLGEQSSETYRRWFEAGAHRYLLRIESSNEQLYRKIHPQDHLHTYKSRITALEALKRTGYQVGTGVMIGLPFQTLEDLADDLLSFKEFDIDMCGMGPYLEHSQTPLWQYRGTLLPQKQRLELSIKMVALLRLMMPDINIAATTAMQTIDPLGREMAIMAGANVIMPNITVQQVRGDYQIYENKPGIEDDAAISKTKLEDFLREKKIPIGYSQWGDSLHFINR